MSDLMKALQEILSEEFLFVVTALVALIPMAFYTGWDQAKPEKDRTEDYSEKFSIGGGILGIIFIVALCAACFFGLVMFICLKWIKLFTYLLRIVLAALAAGLLAYLAGRSRRKKKYRKNPIVKEAVAFCKAHQVKAVQVFPDRLRFFTDVLNSDYCKTASLTEECLDLSDATSRQHCYNRPASWKAYDCPPEFCGDLVFADRGYPSVTDLEMLAKVLKGKLRLSMASHQVCTKYVTKSGNTTTTYITWFYHDCFLFSRMNLQKRLREDAQALIEQEEKRKAAEKAKPKPPAWE